MQFKRNHSESYFYKYAKASTAKLILKEGNFLAQSPLKFNDPFDVQVGMHFGFDVQRFPELFYAKLMSLIESEAEPNFQNRNTMSTFVLRLREAHKAGKREVVQRNQGDGCRNRNYPRRKQAPVYQGKRGLGKKDEGSLFIANL
jgi:hypothetical protein